MKKFFLLLSLLSACVLSSCHKDKTSTQVTSITLSKVNNMKDVSYFVVVNSLDESLKAFSPDLDTSNIIPYLCAKSNSGDLEAVTFQYEMEGATDAAKSFAENNLFVVPLNFVSIGSNYIWLRNCRYYVTNENDCPEEMQSVLFELQSNVYQYIIRKKDGVVLKFKEVDILDRLYLDNSDFYIPMGCISPTEDGFYILTTKTDSRLIKVTDNNTSKPIVENVIPRNCYIESFVCQNNAVAAMGSLYSADAPWTPMVFFPDGNVETLSLRTDFDRIGSQYDVIFSVGGKVYCAICFKNQLDQSELSIYRLNIAENAVNVDSLCTQIVPFVYSDVAQYLPRYTEESTVAFMNGNRLISFSSETEQFETKEIAEFQNVIESYPSFDGCIYGYENNYLDKVLRYNVRTKDVSVFTIDKSDIVPFGYAPRPEFCASKNIFIQYGESIQGRDMTVVTDVLAQSAYSIEAEGKRVSTIYKIQ